MKKTLLALALINVMIAAPAFAQKKKSTKSAPAAAAPAATEQPVYSYNGGSGSMDSGPNFSVQASLGSIGGAFEIGPLVNAEWKMDLEGKPLYLGGQAGVLFGDFTVIPILVTGRYMLGDNSSSMTPYVGASMGVAISTGSSVSVGTVTVSTSSSSTSFTFLARGGVNFGAEKNLFAELPLGAMGGGFAILPTFGYRF
jgi:hypothetical protein